MSPFTPSVPSVLNATPPSREPSRVVFRDGFLNFRYCKTGAVARVSGAVARVSGAVDRFLPRARFSRSSRPTLSLLRERFQSLSRFSSIIGSASVAYLPDPFYLPSGALPSLPFPTTSNYHQERSSRLPSRPFHLPSGALQSLTFPTPFQLPSGALQSPTFPTLSLTIGSAFSRPFLPDPSHSQWPFLYQVRPFLHPIFF